MVLTCFIKQKRQKRKFPFAFLLCSTIYTLTYARVSVFELCTLAYARVSVFELCTLTYARVSVFELCTLTYARVSAFCLFCLLSFVNRRVFQISFADVFGARADKFVVGVLFQNMSRPAGDARNGEDRCVEIERNFHHIIG